VLKRNLKLKAFLSKVSLLTDLQFERKTERAVEV